MGRLTPEELAAFVAKSCDRQGVAVRVTDVRVLANVAILLRGDSRASKLEDRKSGVGDDNSEAPGQLRATGS